MTAEADLADLAAALMLAMRDRLVELVEDDVEITGSGQGINIPGGHAVADFSYSEQGLGFWVEVSCTGPVEEAGDGSGPAAETV